MRLYLDLKMMKLHCSHLTDASKHHDEKARLRELNQLHKDVAAFKLVSAVPTRLMAQCCSRSARARRIECTPPASWIIYLTIMWCMQHFNQAMKEMKDIM